MAASGSIVSGAGTGFEFIKAFDKAVRDLGGNDNHLRRILKERKLVASLAEVIAPCSLDEESRHAVATRYQKTLARRIKESGYKTTPAFEEKIRIPTTEMAGRHFTGVVMQVRRLPPFALSSDSMNTDEYLIDELNRFGCRPATLRELLDWQARARITTMCRIYAMGSPVDSPGWNDYPFLRIVGRKESLGIDSPAIGIAERKTILILGIEQS